MCTAVLRVRYKADKTPQLISFDTEEELSNRIKDLQANEQVSSMSLFRHTWTQDLVQEWRMRQPATAEGKS